MHVSGEAQGCTAKVNVPLCWVTRAHTRIGDAQRELGHEVVRAASRETVDLLKEALTKPITGDKNPAGQKADTFDPAAYQRAKRLAKRTLVGGKPARFDPQLPLS